MAVLTQYHVAINVTAHNKSLLWY